MGIYATLFASCFLMLLFIRDNTYSDKTSKVIEYDERDNTPGSGSVVIGSIREEDGQQAWRRDDL